MRITTLITTAQLAVQRLGPKDQSKNVVMFVVYVCAWLSLINFIIHIFYQDEEHLVFILAVTFLLWLTVLSGTFAEAYAEQRGKAQAASLRAARKDIFAKKLSAEADIKRFQSIPASFLKQGDIVFVEVNDIIPADGQVIQGIASVDESAITGESAPVIREANSDRDGVTGGTRLLSDMLVIRVTSDVGASFLDQMINMVEGARRQRTPNEQALSVFLAAITMIFLVSCVTLLPFTIYSVSHTGVGEPLTLTVLIAFLVCLVPTTIGGLLNAIGIAGMNRMMRANVIASSGRAVEAAGDVNILLLDKTGTITYGNRQPIAFVPCKGVTPKKLAEAALYASVADETPEGKSILQFACITYDLPLPISDEDNPIIALPFTAETRVSGVAFHGTNFLKGAADAIQDYVLDDGGIIPPNMSEYIKSIARQGGTPLMVAQNNEILGLIHLKDIIKQGIKKRLSSLRTMGITSVLITGDNELTASAISAEAGVDDFLAQVNPAQKLAYIRERQERGELIAMVGDGTNDAPALAQADVAVAMQTGTQAAKEASNMIDMDSDPTKLIEIVEIGKQLLITRGALTTFSVATDIAKYFATIPAIFISTVPALTHLNVMQLSSPTTAILSSLTFTVLIIFVLIPLAMRGVNYTPMSANKLLRRNILIYGLGGIILPFIGIKAIDMIISFIIGLAT